MSDMKLIMEGWRQYSKSATMPVSLVTGDPQRIFSDPVDQLLYEHAMGSKKTEDVVLIVEKYIDTQYNAILEEGIIDNIKKGTGKVKDAAKTTLFKFVYGTAGKLIRLINTVMRKMISPIQKLMNNIKAKASEYLKSKEEQSKIVKVLMSVARKVKQVISPIKSGMGKIGKFAYGKSTRFPAFKGCILAVSGAVALLALTCSGLFAGALAFAPVYAGKKIAFAAGMKGVKAGVKAAKAAVAKKAAVAEEIIREMVTEVEEIASVSAEVWSVAKAFIVQAVQTDPDPENISAFAKFAAQTTDDAVGTGASASVSYWTAEDEAMDAAFNALQQMSMDQFQPENITAEDFAMLSEEVRKIMGVAIKMAAEHCENDPTACAGKDLLMDDVYMVFDTTKIATETVSVSSQAVSTVTDLATGAVDKSIDAASGLLTVSDTETIEVVSQAAKDAASQIQLDPAKVAELAKEMGLDNPKKPIEYFRVITRGDKDQLAALARDFGLADEKTKRMGAKKLYKMLSGLGLEDSSAKEITTGVAQSMAKRVAGAGSEVAKIVNEEISRALWHREIIKEVQAI